MNTMQCFSIFYVHVALSGIFLGHECCFSFLCVRFMSYSGTVSLFLLSNFNNSFTCKRAHYIANNPYLLCFSNFMCTTFLSIVLFTFFKDINECLRNTHSCHDNATCTNTKGSFYCTCNVGYSGTGAFCTGEYIFRQV